MATCGICLVADKSVNCVKCMVCICKACTSVLNDTQQNETIILCWMCAGKFTVSNITFRKFCRGCETIGHEIYFDNGKCYSCNWGDGCIEDKRKLLPHYKALPVIEEFLRVKGVAQLIFIYYYEKRRYFPDEI